MAFLKNVRPLMHTLKTEKIINISNGSYMHLLLKKYVITTFKNKQFNTYTRDNIINIGIDIDGLPIAKISKSQLWPILVSVLNFKK